MTCTSNAQQNLLLAALPDTVWQRLQPKLQAVQMPLHQVLYESGRTMSHAYFPTSAIVSLMHITQSGASVESAVVGNDGVVGVALLMGGGSTSSRAVVQTAGRAWRIGAMAIKEEFDRGGPAMQVLLRYTQALMTQLAQRAVCNRHHSLLQQLARCLLSSLDRVRGDELALTQEHIADMLGVRREGVTEGANRLQKWGLIRYSRGHICVLDRAGLQARACECYAVVKNECHRLLPEPRPEPQLDFEPELAMA